MDGMRTTAVLGVEQMASTGLWHGTLRTEDPTPSGHARWRLRTSTTDGFGKASDAAAMIAKAYPDLPPPVVEGMPDLGPLPELDRGFRATRVTPVDGSPRFWETPRFEPLEAVEMDRLVLSGRLELESGSGRDPELSSVYDHFVPTPVSS